MFEGRCLIHSESRGLEFNNHCMALPMLGLQGSILDAGWETGTALGDMREFAMADDAGIRVLGSEFLQQLVKGVLLGFGASIGRLAVLIKTTFIDNAKRTVVVVTGMNALDGLWQQGNDVTIAADIIMVRTLAILGLATGNQVLDTERTVARVCHAVDDEELYGFQWLHNEHGLNG